MKKNRSIVGLWTVSLWSTQWFRSVGRKFSEILWLTTRAGYSQYFWIFTSNYLSCEKRTSVAALTGIFISDPSIAALLLYHFFKHHENIARLLRHLHGQSEPFQWKSSLHSLGNQLQSRERPFPLLLFVVNLLRYIKMPVVHKKRGYWFCELVLIGASLDFICGTVSWHAVTLFGDE